MSWCLIKKKGGENFFTEKGKTLKIYRKGEGNEKKGKKGA